MTLPSAKQPLPPGGNRTLDASFPAGTLAMLEADFQRFGPIYCYLAPGRRGLVYVLNDPDCAGHVLVKNSRNYRKGIGIDRVKLLLGDGLMASEGEVWKRQRQMIQPAFQPKQLARLTAVIAACNQALLARWEDRVPMADFAKLGYSRQVLCEALRLYPPGWLLTRRALSPDFIDGYYVAPGTDVFISPYLLQRHPDHWHQPTAFIPERFAPALAASRHQFAFIPFAAGPRNCIGERLAMLEMQMHLSLAVRRFRLIYLPGQPVELEAKVNLRPKNDLFMIPHRR